MTDYTTTSGMKFRLLTIAVVMLGVSACEAPVRQEDYQAQHPINVIQKEIAFSIDLPKDTKALSSENQLTLNRHIATYLQKGRGQVIVKMSPDGFSSTRQKARVRDLLWQQGIHTQSVDIVKDEQSSSNGGKATISFAYNEVEVPECGDWTTSATYNWSNRSPANHGCSIQRNLGLSVANPAHLKKGATFDNSDSARAQRIINGYKSGSSSASSTSSN